MFGDVHSHQNPALTALALVWFRYHNALAEECQLQHPDWSDSQVFHWTRRRVIATLQVRENSSHDDHIVIISFSTVIFWTFKESSVHVCIIATNYFGNTHSYFSLLKKYWYSCRYYKLLMICVHNCQKSHHWHPSLLQTCALKLLLCRMLSCMNGCQLSWVKTCPLMEATKVTLIQPSVQCLKLQPSGLATRKSPRGYTSG